MNLIKHILFLIVLSLMTLKISVLASANLFNPYLALINKVDGIKLVKSNKNDEKIHQTNKIIKIWMENDDMLNVTAEIKDNKEEVRISVYNMLGKEVRKIYQGLPLEKDNEGYYRFTSLSSLNLPNNIYILVLQGKTYKIADKFIISK